MELETDWNKARSRRKPHPLRSKPVTIGDLIRDGKLLEVHCASCRPERHLCINPEILRLPKRMPMPEVASTWFAASAVPGIVRPTTHLGEAGYQGRRCGAIFRPFRGQDIALTIRFMSIDRPASMGLRRGKAQWLKVGAGYSIERNSMLACTE